jgi:rhodanese-related sulfurtransferase
MPSGIQVRNLLLRSFLIAAASAAVAVAVNASRPDPLPWLAPSEYEIYEDCPEAEDSSTVLSLSELRGDLSFFFLVDCRPAEEFAEGHAEGALSVPYDPLFAVSEEDLAKIQDAAGTRTVVVVGDSLTARLLANDLVAQGLEAVRYLEKGADWRALLPAGAE